MEYVVFKELETDRLLLRKQQVEDISSYHEELASSKQVAAYMLWNASDDISVTAENLVKCLDSYQEKGYYRWIIEKKDSHQLIGVIQLVRLDEKENSCEFAYMLGEKHWNQGFMTEALQRVFAFVFLELKLSVIRADHFCENPASGKVMLKAGMKCIGQAIDVHQNDKGLNEVTLYQITKENFLQMSQNQRS